MKKETETEVTKEDAVKLFAASDGQKKAQKEIDEILTEIRKCGFLKKPKDCDANWLEGKLGEFNTALNNQELTLTASQIELVRYLKENSLSALLHKTGGAGDIRGGSKWEIQKRLIDAIEDARKFQEPEKIKSMATRASTALARGAAIVAGTTLQTVGYVGLGASALALAASFAATPGYIFVGVFIGSCRFQRVNAIVGGTVNMAWFAVVVVFPHFSAKLLAAAGMGVVLAAAAVASGYASQALVHWGKRLVDYGRDGKKLTRQELLEKWQKSMHNGHAATLAKVAYRGIDAATLHSTTYNDKQMLDNYGKFERVKKWEEGVANELLKKMD